MSHDALAPYKVHAIKELKRQARSGEALAILQQIANQVQPILRKRKWTVPKLHEFFPTNPNLLVRAQRCCPQPIPTTTRSTALAAGTLAPAPVASSSQERSLQWPIIPQMVPASCVRALKPSENTVRLSMEQLPQLTRSQAVMQGLNINGRRGTTSEIRVRLRPHNTPNEFYPYEHVLGTMLHEVCPCLYPQRSSCCLQQRWPGHTDVVPAASPGLRDGWIGIP